MNDNQIEELIDRAIREEQNLPEGFSERLEEYIDRLAADQLPLPQTPATDGKGRNLRCPSPFRLALYWISGIAAMWALCLGLAKWADTSRQAGSPLADTYSNPKEAAKAATEALTFLSSNLNKGLEEVNKANRDWAEVNGILNKYLKE